jgi:AdoMet-dependent heme synthase
MPQIETLFDKITKETELEGVTLGGGEPLVRPDILDIAACLKRKKIKTGIITNATLLDEATVQKLINNGISYFEISLPSLDRQLYNKLCGSERLEKVRKAILYAKERKALLTIAYVATKLNINDIENIIDLGFAFGADTVAINRFVPTGTGKKNFEQLHLSDNELAQVLSRADKKAQELKFPVTITVPIEHCKFDHRKYPSLRFGVCCCGQRKWTIDSLGNLRTCEQNREILGSLFEKSFSELAASQSVRQFRNNNATKECQSCDYLTRCGGGCRFAHS